MDMAIKYDHIYVALGSAQARRRLKGHGFGVRRVETAGNGRALIVHTATDENLRQLVMLFQDVIEPWDEEIVRVILENPRISDAELLTRFNWFRFNEHDIKSARRKAKLRTKGLPVPTSGPTWLGYLP
jgi:hypothetical protein